ncbi:ATP-binding protein [Pseudonocardia sp. GCM10023141]|uniref:ATP-binding protein n=1 Tax=Pseudonocardia sp. GCM10023141 TaxID=3252653 RepID=UPI00360DA796
MEVTASVARGLLNRWLSSMAWPPAQRDDIVLAVNEAISNAIEHAYLAQPAGHIQLDATAAALTPSDAAAAGAPGQRYVTIQVRDHGVWRPAPADDENRRRGIPIMRACMDTVTIEALVTPAGDPAGTRVTLRSNPVPPPENTTDSS